MTAAWSDNDQPRLERQPLEPLDDLLGYLMALDGLNRNESCGGHFREEYQTAEGEALRQDDKYSYAACWLYKGEDQDPELIKEDLKYEFTIRAQRNYKS